MKNLKMKSIAHSFIFDIEMFLMAHLMSIVPFLLPGVKVPPGLRTCPFNDQGSKRSVLNLDGLAKLDEICQLVQESKFDEILSDYEIVPIIPIGPLIESDHQIQQDYEILSLNVKVIGKIRMFDVFRVVTINVLFFTKEWAFSTSGHLYKLTK